MEQRGQLKVARLGADDLRTLNRDESQQREYVCTSYGAGWWREGVLYLEHAYCNAHSNGTACTAIQHHNNHRLRCAQDSDIGSIDSHVNSSQCIPCTRKHGVLRDHIPHALDMQGEATAAHMSMHQTTKVFTHHECFYIASVQQSAHTCTAVSL